MESVPLINKCISSDNIHQNVCEFAAVEYWKRYSIDLSVFPDIFIYVTIDDIIIGCFGAYRGSIHNRLTTEWYVSEDDLSSFIGESITRFPRSKLAEIGTRAVNLPTGTQTSSTRVSVAMSAALLLCLFEQGERFSLFTADRSVQVIAKQLNVRLTRFGKPDLSNRDNQYQELWKNYFEIPRECFGLDLQQAATGCYMVCDKVSQSGFVFEPNLFTPSNELFTMAV